MRLSRWFLVMWFVLPGLSAVSAQDGNKELEKLKGTWEVTELVADGKIEPAWRGVKVTIAGDILSLAAPDEPNQRAFRLKLDPSKKPKEIDATPLDGEFQGQTNPGLYELNGDVFRLCMSNQGENKKRPTQLASPKDSLLFLFTLKRVKTP